MARWRRKNINIQEHIGKNITHTYLITYNHINMPGFLKIVHLKKSNKKAVASKASKRSRQEAAAVNIPVKALYGAMM